METPRKPLHLLEADVIEALKSVYDPELPVNIYDLGLIYGLDVQDDGRVNVRMTLTAPGCPAAQFLPGQVEDAVRTVEGVTEAHVELVWEPPYHKGLMSEEARLDLGLW
ncbi:MAG TPA: SUF system Fe-S cluster assembly protein [Rhodothermales bacterium]|nr:SUF system Fe-S cluster assembly protein [Rhodothermales bacterium]